MPRVDPCFLAERTDRANIYLRRYVQSSAARCSALGYHNAKNVIGETEFPLSDRLEGRSIDPDKSDSRWPQHCQCGYAFAADDEWQAGTIRLYRIPDGRLFESSELPIGAMFFASWYAEAGFGEGLTVMLPDKTLWCIDGPASNAPGKLPGWSREGTPPLITASPSIQTPGYHGFLRNGRLEEC